MIPENDPIAINLNERCIEAKDRKYCDIYHYYISVARILSRIRVKVPRGIEIPGVIPRVDGPDPAPELLPGRLIEYLFVRDGDPDPIPAKERILEASPASIHVKGILEQARHLRERLADTVRQLESEISQLEKTAL